MRTGKGKKVREVRRKKQEKQRGTIGTENRKEKGRERKKVPCQFSVLPNSSVDNSIHLPSTYYKFGVALHICIEDNVLSYVSENQDPIITSVNARKELQVILTANVIPSRYRSANTMQVFSNDISTGRVIATISTASPIVGHDVRTQSTVNFNQLRYMA